MVKTLCITCGARKYLYLLQRYLLEVTSNNILIYLSYNTRATPGTLWFNHYTWTTKPFLNVQQYLQTMNPEVQTAIHPQLVNTKLHDTLIATFDSLKNAYNYYSCHLYFQYIHEKNKTYLQLTISTSESDWKFMSQCKVGGTKLCKGKLTSSLTTYYYQTSPFQHCIFKYLVHHNLLSSNK